MSFVHLHNHTEYSMLDGAAKTPALIAAAVNEGMPAIATTDHGYVFGTYEFYKTARQFEIKPVIGVEAYLTPRTSRIDRARVKWGNGGRDDISGNGAYTHMTMWAKNNDGMHNLFRMSSMASLEGFFHKPRMDRELLQSYAPGLIASTGCASGEVQTLLRFGKYHEARQAAADFRDIFGADNFYVEVMDHSIDVERRTLADLRRLSQDLGIPMLATNDLHYVKKGDSAAHAALLCVQTGAKLTDSERFQFGSDEFYLKSAAQMRELFRDFPGACDNTLAVAEACEVTFVEKEGAFMPAFPLPAGESEESWFIKEVDRGLASRWPDGVPTVAREQASYEENIIIDKRYAGYFLVVADFVQWAKEQGIRVGAGRGSGPGSMCAYAMGITGLDPLRHKLKFERFLNPERDSMPDFDIDFDERRRGEVIQYVVDKYGSDRVAQIVTYGTMKAKAALKDAARVRGMPYSHGEALSQAYPADLMGKSMPLGGVIDRKHPRYGDGETLRTVLSRDPESAQTFTLARGLEGVKRQWGVHAAGVLMSSVPLMDVIPVMKREEDGVVLSQFDYPTCEALGLVKMDFLGLAALTTFSAAEANIINVGKTPPSLEDGPLDDEATYALLRTGHTLGVFQFDGAPMRALLRAVEPTGFEDVSAVGALYRPGPMAANAHNDYADRKNNRKPIVAIHPELKEALAPILAETYGLIVYQEQVMEIAQKLAGYTLGRADMLRRAMGKKKREVLDAEYVGFEAGMVNNGFSPNAIKSLWDVLLPFSDYAFNRSHSAAYGLISYWGAYLKAHFPAEYMSAVLTSVGDDKAKTALYLNECRRMGLRVLSPDVNESMNQFVPVEECVRFGMGAVRGVGSAVVAAIVAAREEGGPFATFEDFTRRVPTAACTKQVTNALIKAGAFDSLGQPRQGLVAVHSQVVDASTSAKKGAAMGMDSLFDEPLPEIAVPNLEWDASVLLGFEREMLGLYVSAHPLDGLESLLSEQCDAPILTVLTDADTYPDETHVTVAGLITEVEVLMSKKNTQYAKVMIEDLTGPMFCLVLGKSFLAHEALLQTDRVAQFRGQLQRKDDEATFFVNNVTLPLLDGEPLTADLALEAAALA